MSLFTAEQEDRISAAITAAEKNTSGEILAVVAPRSDHYYAFAVIIAALVALIVPWPFIYLTWHPVQWIYLIQLIVFAGMLAILLTSPLRFHLVPKRIMRETAHRRAVEQFLAQNLHTTNGRTGVLIFVSLVERYAEIIADHAIDQKVAKGTWQRLVDDLIAELAADRPTEGFVKTVEACGRLLAEHFPPGGNDPNELPNHLIVLR